MQIADQMAAALPLVAVVGRPNVGKSTLVNRLVGSREAIVEDTPGVTRDRLYMQANWVGHDYVAIDTGGIIPDEVGDKLLIAVQAQTELAIAEADVVVFLVDGREGLTPVDMEIANRLRRTKKPVLLTVNKLDNQKMDLERTDFYRLGLGEPHSISAMHGLGVGDLLDEIAAHFPERPPPPPAEEILRVALVGRPNVGKSSMVNALLGSNRLIVDDVAGTTRDAIDTLVTYEGTPFLLIDTAGIRRKAKVQYGIEGFAVVRALKAIARADVVVLLVDAIEGVTAQDQRIAGMIDDAGKACVVVVNKWDLVPDKDANTMTAHQAEVLRELFFVNYAQLIYTSALTRQRIHNILAAANAAAEENQRRVPTGLLNEVLREAMALRPPPTDKGRSVKLGYATQVSVGPPTFVLFVNNPDLMPASYKRYLEGKLREAFGFIGTPVRFILRDKGEGGKGRGRKK